MSKSPRSLLPHQQRVLAHSQWQREPPAEVLAEREFAFGSDEPRTITQEFFGDPLPGRSALDHRVRFLMQG